MVDLLKSKFEKLDISSFPDQLKFMEYTFHNESTEHLIEAIRQFESNTPEQGSFHDTHRNRFLLHVTSFLLYVIVVAKQIRSLWS